jgi:hypothetical protein
VILDNARILDVMKAEVDAERECERDSMEAEMYFEIDPPEGKDDLDQLPDDNDEHRGPQPLSDEDDLDQVIAVGAATRC